MKNSQLLIAFAFLLISCSQNFTNTHKMYKGAPAKNESIGFVKLGEAFMLTRANWFAEKLSLNEDSIYKDLENISDSIIYSELSKQWSLSAVPANKRESFSRETLKMDKTIFIKTRLPEQGIEVANENGVVPNYLFIIHEYTVGTDFEAESFYDYTKANLEMTQSKKVKNLSIIATWTLWDNKKQIPLKSGIASSQTPIKNDSIDMNLFIKATKTVIEQCLKKLYLSLS
ncbi:MAG: hypothetical protein LBC85_00155 [Fibromonadaceae bacterium]|nr:hypothetical protein [Fibromonadaceae bacterium]